MTDLIERMREWGGLDFVEAIDLLSEAADALERMQWNTDMDAAPRGGGAEMVTDPDYVVPPKLLLQFEDGEYAVCYWDWYYAEGGRGYEGHLAWVIAGGELAAMVFGDPTKWMHLPKGE